MYKSSSSNENNGCNKEQQDIKIQSYYVVNEFFQSNGKNKKTILEEYIIKEASSLL